VALINRGVPIGLLNSGDPGVQVRGVHITLRMRLECVVMRKGKQLIPPVEVLNEVVVDRGSNPFLTKIECWEHNRLLTKVCRHLNPGPPLSPLHFPFTFSLVPLTPFLVSPSSKTVQMSP
jgi:hypothetical protein